MIRVLGPHKNLQAWKISMELAKTVYETTMQFPNHDRFVLSNQRQRCAISIPSNIAEGYGRGTNQELIRFLHISLGSSNELDTQIELAHNVGFLNDDKYEEMTVLNDRVNKMIQALIKKRQQM